MDPVEWWSAGVSMTLTGVIVIAVFSVVGAMLLRRVGLSHRLRPAPGTLEWITIKPYRFWRVFGRYSYTVDGHVYRGHRIGLEFDSYDTHAQVLAVAGGLAPGPVTVWYDPRKPSFAVLNKTPPDRFGVFRWGIPIGVAVALAGIAVAITHWHAAFSAP